MASAIDAIKKAQKAKGAQEAAEGAQEAAEGAQELPRFVTTAEAWEAYRKKRITMEQLEEACAEIEQRAARSAAGASGALQVRLNRNADLFVRDPEVKAYSKKKDKNYIPSLNLPWPLAVALFGRNAGLRERVCEYVQGIEDGTIEPVVPE